MITARLPLLERVLYLLYTRPSVLMEVTLPSKFEEIAEKYKRGIAQAIGVSPEDINEEVVKRWAVHWLRAMIKPEAWEKYGLI